MDLVIHGTDALLVDKASLEKNDGSSISTIQTWGDDNGGAACLSSDPAAAAAECWPDISDAGYARRGVSFSMDGSWTDIGFYQLSTIQEPSCPSGLELSQAECEPAAISLGLDYTVFQVSSSTTIWSHIPCGCSYMSEVVDGLTNKLVYNTNTVNCQWETRTIGNLCKLSLVSQTHASNSFISALFELYFNNKGAN